MDRTLAQPQVNLGLLRSKKNFEIPASVGSNKVTADSVPGTAGGKQMDWTHWLL
jgi:hypothetical protein